jgi:hypothetical protein
MQLLPRIIFVGYTSNPIEGPAVNVGSGFLGLCSDVVSETGSTEVGTAKLNIYKYIHTCRHWQMVILGRIRSPASGCGPSRYAQELVSTRIVQAPVLSFF